MWEWVFWIFVAALLLGLVWFSISSATVKNYNVKAKRRSSAAKRPFDD
jgi:hypothetical protein